MPPTREQVNVALSTISESMPDEARVLREHLNTIFLHPMVLAERSASALEVIRTDMGLMAARLDMLDDVLLKVAAAEIKRLEAETALTQAQADEKQAELARQQESGQWIRDSVTSFGSWLGSHIATAVAVVATAAAMWVAMKLGVEVSP